MEFPELCRWHILEIRYNGGGWVRLVGSGGPAGLEWQAFSFLCFFVICNWMDCILGIHSVMSRLNKWMRLNGKGLGQNEFLVQGFKVSDLERVFFFFCFFCFFSRTTA